MLKLKPFEDYIGDEPVFNYVGIRADEDREGYISHKENITPVFPFRENGIDYGGVIKILEDAGVGMPTYTQWGRTRSGCYFCFYQQKIEWVRLKEAHPDLFEKAKAYEKELTSNDNPFYWNSDESLENLEKPERIAAIIANWETRQARLKRDAPDQPLVSVLGGLEDAYEPRSGCTICSL